MGGLGDGGDWASAATDALASGAAEGPSAASTGALASADSSHPAAWPSSAATLPPGSIAGNKGL